MGLNFNSLLLEAGIDPAQVRLLRHQTTLPNGLTPFDLWHRDRAAFDEYQSYQPVSQRAYFASPYWANFLGLHDGRTLFSGLYQVGAPEVVSETINFEATDQQFGGGTDERYPIKLADELSAYIGRLYIDWGGGPSGKRAWKQLAESSDAKPKVITELHLEGSSAPFPGFGAFLEPLSQVLSLPRGWKQLLSATKGVYLLTCPDTKEVYVGSATGSDGFLGRWTEYALNGHGGNVVLKRRQPSDYRVSILEVAGSHTSDADILALEQRLKMKLQSREMGLNAN